MTVAEDSVLADQVAHAGAAVGVRLQPAKLKHFAGSFGHPFVNTNLLAYLFHSVTCPDCIQCKKRAQFLRAKVGPIRELAPNPHAATVQYGSAPEDPGGGG